MSRRNVMNVDRKPFGSVYDHYAGMGGRIDRSQRGSRKNQSQRQIRQSLNAHDDGFDDDIDELD